MQASFIPEIFKHFRSRWSFSPVCHSANWNWNFTAVPHTLIHSPVAKENKCNVTVILTFLYLNKSIKLVDLDLSPSIFLVTKQSTKKSERKNAKWVASSKSDEEWWLQVANASTDFDSKKLRSIKKRGIGKNEGKIRSETARIKGGERDR